MRRPQRLKDVKWVKVTAPGTWRPKPGEELVGHYGGRTRRDGQHGQYDVVLVLVPYRGTFTVSGTALIQLVDAAALEKGDAVRVVFQGVQDLGGGKTMKLFELYVSEGPAMTADERREAQLS